MFTPAGLGQTIAVVDQSGKVVSTGKHLFNIFKDVKAAYRERKAEIAAAAQHSPSSNGGRARMVRAYTLDDVSSTGASSRHSRSRSHRHHHHRSRANGERGGGSGSGQRHRHHSDYPPAGADRRSSVLAPIDTTVRSPTGPYGEQYPPYSAPGLQLQNNPPYPSPYPEDHYWRRQQQQQYPPADLVRRHTAPYEVETSPRGRVSPSEQSRGYSPENDGTTLVGPLSPGLRRSFSAAATAVDMDLAYGEPPHDLMATASPRSAPLLSPAQRSAALTTLVHRARGLLVEADCLQHGVTTTLTKLQQNPDALAAVALTLAEISKVVKRLGPGGLATVRRTAPAVFALLSSPTFLVAVGVGVGVTAVALGGYKIVRKMQEQKALSAGAAGGREALLMPAGAITGGGARGFDHGDDNADEVDEVEEKYRSEKAAAEMSHIETWRQGIAEVESQSVGTSVEGEFITPAAASLSRLTLQDGGGPRDAGSRSNLIPVPSRARSVRTERSTSTSTSATEAARKKSGAAIAREGERRDKKDKEKKNSNSNSSSKNNSNSSAGGTKKAKPAKKSSPLRTLFSP